MVELLSREYEISYSHIDNRGIAKPSFLWSMMQDAATVHAEALGLGPAALGVVWVLSRIKATLTRPLLPYERVRCETWCPGFKGPSWYRCRCRAYRSDRSTSCRHRCGTGCGCA